MSEFLKGYADTALTVCASKKQCHLSKENENSIRKKRTPAAAKKSQMLTLHGFLQMDTNNWQKLVMIVYKL